MAKNRRRISAAEYNQRKKRLLDPGRIRQKYGGSNTRSERRNKMRSYDAAHGRGRTSGFKMPNLFGIGKVLGVIFIPAVVIIGGLFVWKFIMKWGVKFGFMDAPDTKALVEYYENGRIKTIEQAQQQKQLIFKANPPTKTMVQAVECAEGIYTLLRNLKSGTFSITYYLDTAQQKEFYNFMTRVNNDADVMQIIDAFGERSVYAFLFVPYRTQGLTAYIHSLMKPDYIRDLNNYYAGKKIKFQF